MKQASTQSNGAITNGHTNIKIVQNIRLICLDSNVDVSSAGYLDIITQLRCIVNDINVFTDHEECVEFIRTINDNKICMITSGSFAQHIVPYIHNMSQVDSILITSDSRKNHEKWTKQWSKIRGIYTDMSTICEALKQASKQCEQNAISISLMATNDNSSSKNLDPAFLCTNIMREILLTTKFDQQNFKKFIDYCRGVFESNKNELANISEFERNYRNKTPIWWYARENFLYPMINRALRTMDVDLINKMSFFIADLHRHIDKLHSEQFSNPQATKTFTVYRGQGLSNIAFEQMKKTKGGLISFNNFLCTTKDRNVSLPFAYNALADPDSVGILFVITVEPSKSTSPFASINGVSYSKEKDEVLFSMHTSFRIHGIKPMNENQRLFQIGLIFTGENDKDHHLLTDCIREETLPYAEGWYRLGCVLLKLGQSRKAQYVYEILLEQATDENEKAYIYHRLGWIKYDQEQYNEALTFYEKALAIYQKSLPPNHINFVNIYNTIGLVYKTLTKYPKALTYYEKVLDIQEQSLPSNQLDLIASYSTIANMYYILNEYLKALFYYEKALDIQQQLLPPNHPDLAVTYNSIGEAYRSMGVYSKALLFHENTLRIRQQLLPSNHPDLAFAYNNIGNIYYNMDEYMKALSNYEKSLAIREQSLPPNHPDLAASYNNIGIVYRSIGEYSKALLSHKIAVEIREQSLPSNHPDLAASYTNIGKVYHNMGEYKDALLSHGKALEIQLQTLSLNHPDLAVSYCHGSNVYSSMGNYSKAIAFCERAVNIAQQSLPADHPHLQWYKNTLSSLKQKL